MKLKTALISLSAITILLAGCVNKDVGYDANQVSNYGDRQSLKKMNEYIDKEAKSLYSSSYNLYKFVGNVNNADYGLYKTDMQEIPIIMKYSSSEGLTNNIETEKYNEAIYHSLVVTDNWGYNYGFYFDIFAPMKEEYKDDDYEFNDTYTLITKAEEVEFLIYFEDKLTYGENLTNLANFMNNFATHENVENISFYIVSNADKKVSENYAKFYEVYKQIIKWEEFDTNIQEVIHYRIQQGREVKTDDLRYVIQSVQ